MDPITQPQNTAPAASGITAPARPVGGDVIHPAHLMPVGDLIDGLFQANRDGLVSMQSDGPLRLFNYTDRCVFDKAWTPWTTVARGLIIDVGTKERIVATPLAKFWNYGEHAGPLPNEPFEVTEKVDGSMVALWFYNGQWRTSTRGSFKSDQAVWAMQWADEHMALSLLDPNVTYICEAVYPENRIVVPYGERGLILLAEYDNVTGRELTHVELSVATVRGWFLRCASRYPYDSIDGLLRVAQALPFTEEGFVVRFASGFRIKIKGDEYCRVHRLISRVTPLAVWDMMVAGDDTAVVRRQLPEEFQLDFDAILRLLSERFEAKTRAVNLLVQEFAHNTNREVAEFAQSHASQDVSDLVKWALNVRNHGPLDAMLDPAHKKGTTRRRFMVSFRPTGNVLDGYVPSTAMNRFSQEAG